MHCDVVSAEKSIFSGIVQTLVCNGESGELGIKPGHAPLLTKLSPGPLELVKQDGTHEYVYVEGGFLEVQPNIITVLADVAVRAEDIDESAAEKAKLEAEKAVADSLANHEFAQVSAQLAKAIGQLRTLKESRKMR